MEFLGILIAILLVIGALKGVSVLSRTTAEQRMVRWKSMAGTNVFELPRDYNPMFIALTRRDVIQKLVRTGHAYTSRTILTDVDMIISTIECTQNAMKVYGFGEFAVGSTRAQNGSPIRRWVTNDNEQFVALYEDARNSLNKLSDIIEYVRGVANQGVKNSAESAMAGERIDVEIFDRGMTQPSSEEKA